MRGVPMKKDEPVAELLRNALQTATALQTMDHRTAATGFRDIREKLARVLVMLGEPNAAAVKAAKTLLAAPHSADPTDREARDWAAVILRAQVEGGAS